jgi:lactoylglutathione lyase
VIRFPPNRCKAHLALLAIYFQGGISVLKKAEHVGIRVSDMDRSIAWYTQVLGLTLRKRVRMNEETELAFLPIGEVELELIFKTNQPPEPKREGVVHHLAFTVDDVAEALSRLREHGVELINEEPIYREKLSAQIAFFYGPDGERLELFAPMKEQR